jgi:hypothetical protein
MPRLRAEQATLGQRPAGPAPIVGPLSRASSGGAASSTPMQAATGRETRGAQRARMLGGSSRLPPQVGAKTGCERAAPLIVAREVKRHGICGLSVGKIAAEAGVCARTVQNAVAEAIRWGYLAREERPQRGRKNLPNILPIISAEWLTWIKRGPRVQGLHRYKDHLWCKLAGECGAKACILVHLSNHQSRGLPCIGSGVYFFSR